ncbi:hypothetical protein QOT17_002819 [Balamuthia mandrillaris]
MAMNQSYLMFCAVLLCGFVALAQGCSCTFAVNVYMNLTGSCAPEETVDQCTQTTANEGECMPFPGFGWGSMYVDCLGQRYHVFNSSDCSGHVGTVVTADQCLVSPSPQGLALSLVKWNEDCNGETVPMQNEQECEPAPEPEEDEKCFFSLTIGSDCSPSQFYDCLGEGWLNHNECILSVFGGGSMTVDCINHVGLLFPASNCTGPALPFANDMCSPIQGGMVLNGRWGKTCDGEPVEASDSKEESEPSDESDDMEDSESSDEESSQNDGSESEGDGSSSASSLRFDLFC